MKKWKVERHRDWRKGFEEKKSAVLNGKTLSIYEQTKQRESQSLSPTNTNMKSRSGSTQGVGQNSGKDLATVRSKNYFT